MAAPATAQTRVSLVVRLAPPRDPTGAARARVTVRDLLTDSRWSQAASMIDCKGAFAMDAFWRGHTSPVKWNQPPANALCIS